MCHVYRKLTRASKAAKLISMVDGKEGPVPPNLSEYLREIGRRGGKARLKKMTKEERSDVARKAAAASAAVRTKKAANKKAAASKKSPPKTS